MTVVNDEPKRILLVEDDPHDIELIHMALEPLNFINQINVVTDGQQALRYLLGDDYSPPVPLLPHLVLLDLKLPRVSGLQVLQTLRAHPRTKQLVIVVMTSSQEDSDLKACYDLCCNSYIVKPVDFQQFLNVTDSVGVYWGRLNKSPLFVAS